jgi:hypothetical protein
VKESVVIGTLPNKNPPPSQQSSTSSPKPADSTPSAQVSSSEGESSIESISQKIKTFKPLTHQ